MFNASYSVNNYVSFINSSQYSYGNEVVILADITKEVNKFICTLDGTEIPVEQFYIYRRKGFLTTIVVQLAEDLWDFVKDKTGSELIITWKSQSFEGDMANSLIQNVSFQYNAHRRIVKLHAFRAIKEVAQRMFTIDAVEELTFENNILKKIKTIPQPTISPEDTINYLGIKYSVESVKITANTITTKMDITLHG